MPPTDAPRCGNCKFWRPMYTAFNGWCDAPVPRCIFKVERDAMHDYDGDDCQVYAPKEPDK